MSVTCRYCGEAAFWGCGDVQEWQRSHRNACVSLRSANAGLERCYRKGLYAAISGLDTRIRYSDHERGEEYWKSAIHVQRFSGQVLA